MDKKNKIEIIEPTTSVKGQGNVLITIDHEDGTSEQALIRNTLLRAGKIALAQSLANNVNEPYDFYINKMIFGTNGVSSDTPKFVDESRTGLFGATAISKNVISSIDPAAPTTVIFTSVIGFSEVIGSVLNEMALVMADGDLYSMLTFPNLSKTGQIQLTFNWYISFL